MYRTILHVKVMLEKLILELQLRTESSILKLLKFRLRQTPLNLVKIRII